MYGLRSRPRTALIGPVKTLTVVFVGCFQHFRLRLSGTYGDRRPLSGLERGESPTKSLVSGGGASHALDRPAPSATVQPAPPASSGPAGGYACAIYSFNVRYAGLCAPRVPSGWLPATHPPRLPAHRRAESGPGRRSRERRNAAYRPQDPKRVRPIRYRQRGGSSGRRPQARCSA